jgi:hypothetical protein
MSASFPSSLWQGRQLSVLLSDLRASALSFLFVIHSNA